MFLGFCCPESIPVNLVTPAPLNPGRGPGTVGLIPLYPPQSTTGGLLSVPGGIYAWDICCKTHVLKITCHVTKTDSKTSKWHKWIDLAQITSSQSVMGSDMNLSPFFSSEAGTVWFFLLWAYFQRGDFNVFLLKSELISNMMTEYEKMLCVVLPGKTHPNSFSIWNF